MLYTTTRSEHDTYTPERALKEACAPDGGFYIPMQPLDYSSDELASLLGQSDNGIIASVMNRLFNSKLTERELDFSLGKEFFQLKTMSHRITIAENWRNPDGDFARIQRLLTERIAIDKRKTPVGEWMQVASRIAMLCCIFSRIGKQGNMEPGMKIDVAVISGDLYGPMAAWYAREMGLNIGNIICCCNENGSVWDLLQRGEMKTKPQVQKTVTPRCDVGIPTGVERLIRATLGLSEAQRYCSVCMDGGVYELNPELHRLLRQGMYASVVSDKRLSGVIANVFATNGYILCPYSALSYAGLMDYRAATGQNGSALIVSDTSPILCEEAVAKAMGISVPELHERLDIIV